MPAYAKHLPPSDGDTYVDAQGVVMEYVAREGAWRRFQGNLTWLGTQAEYDALPSKNPSTVYLIREAA